MGAVTLILIMTIVLLITAVTLAWTVMNATGFFEVSEINAVKSEFEACNNKIFETSRTGIVNTCIFSVSRGQLIGTNESIKYELVSFREICDESPWILILPEKNLWQMCHISGNKRIYGLKWNSSYINFEFESFGGVEVRGETGSKIEMSRSSMSQDKTTLKIRIY